VARDVRELGLEKLVVDPVMVAKSGDPLLQPDARDTLIRELLPLALVVTPNLHEASVLVGFPVKDRQSMEAAARAIKAFGPEYVVVKGGHLEGEPMDLLYDGRDFVAFQNKRFDTPHTHGTGCTFASAVAAGLAKGLSVPDAVAQAKDYITGAIERGLAIGRGHGPVHHFYRLYDLAGWSFG
jgi:hydroxymethylpyrimidine/phosphomethylpyrimidine kinase